MKYEIIESELSGQFIKQTGEDGTISFVPMAEDNADYQHYLRWLENPQAALSTPIATD